MWVPSSPSKRIIHRELTSNNVSLHRKDLNLKANTGSQLKNANRPDLFVACMVNMGE